MRVLVCGGRDYDNWKRINKTMSALDKESSISLIIQGGANGADWLAAKWATPIGIHLARLLGQCAINGCLNLASLNSSLPLAAVGGRRTWSIAPQMPELKLSVYSNLTGGIYGTKPK